MKNCPLCAALVAQEAEECLSCGVIFAKHQARVEREKAAASPAQETGSAKSPALNPWRVRLAALTLVAGWMLVLGIYYRIELQRRPLRAKSITLEGRSTVPLRGANGLIGEIPVHVSRAGAGAAAGDAAPAPSPPAADSEPAPFDE